MCGKDELTGKNFEHRREWIEEKLTVLNDVFAIDIYRQRLIDISWFMRILNEGIARQANAEEGCTGRFWEGRFKSQALLDEAAIAA